VKLCALLVLLYAPDANAWGLQTHVFLAHYALSAVPLADPALRAAAQGLPRLVLAGACLPDLAIVSRFFLHSPAFRRSHLWATLRRIAASPRTDYDRALAFGYATHLVSDVVAHNEFVPEHEARIGRTAMIGHLVSEWAMDDWLEQDSARGGARGGWRARRAVRRARLPLQRGVRVGTLAPHRLVGLDHQREILLGGEAA